MFLSQLSHFHSADGAQEDGEMYHGCSKIEHRCESHLKATSDGIMPPIGFLPQNENFESYVHKIHLDDKFRDIKKQKSDVCSFSPLQFPTNNMILTDHLFHLVDLILS